MGSLGSKQLIARSEVFKNTTLITVPWTHEKNNVLFYNMWANLGGENSSRFDRHLMMVILEKMASHSTFFLSQPSYTSSSSYKCNCWLLGSLPSFYPEMKIKESVSAVVWVGIILDPSFQRIKLPALKTDMANSNPTVPGSVCIFLSFWHFILCASLFFFPFFFSPTPGFLVHSLWINISILPLFLNCFFIRNM